MLQVIDHALYADAAALLAQANGVTATIASDLFDALGAAAVSAGHGDGTRRWCTAYEQRAGAVTDQLSQLVDAFGNCAVLLHASGRNHDRAEAAAAPYGIPAYAPRGIARDLRSVSLSGIPAMYGGSDDEPLGWSIISSHVFGAWWPGADLTRVRALATAWHAAAYDLTSTTYFPSLAIGQLDAMTSPELPDATDVCRRLADACTTLAGDCDALGQACTALADDVQEQRDRVNHLVKEFFGAAGITELLALGFSVLSGGVSELVSKAIDTGILARYGARICAVLDTLSATLSTSSLTLAVADAGKGLSPWLSAVADAKPVLAEIDGDEAVLATALGVGVAGGAAAGSATAARYSVTAAQMEDWERTTRSHTIRKHVGRSHQDLMERLAREKSLKRTSTFNDLGQAVSHINRVLHARQSEIDSWIASPDTLPRRVRLRINEDMGHVVSRSGTSVPGRVVVVELVKDSRQADGYRVNTAFLER